MRYTTLKLKQHGFFSMGLAFGLMVLFGGAAVVVSPDTENQSRLINQDSKAVYESTQVVQSKVD